MYICVCKKPIVEILKCTEKKKKKTRKSSQLHDSALLHTIEEKSISGRHSHCSGSPGVTTYDRMIFTQAVS